MTDDEEKMPRISVMEKAAPNRGWSFCARYRTGMSSPAAALPFSRIAVVMTAMQRMTTKAPRNAPARSSCLEEAETPRRVKYMLGGKKFRLRCRTALRNQLGAA